MKQNVEFFTIVLSLLLLSFIILTGCMYSIIEDEGEMKPYDLNVQKQNSDDSDGNVVEDAPMTQDSLQVKFESMYEISEDGKTITVISKDYLSEYWYSNYEKEVIHSLTTEEVYFIIQDSIRIYEEYDKVVLANFASLSSTIQVAERFPILQAKIIKTQPDVIPYYDSDSIEAIYEIILYRLKALSSPKTFFTGEEALRFVGEEPYLYSTMLPWTTFYIPNYSDGTNRDYILFAVGYGNKMNSTIDEDEFSDLFSFCNKNGAYVNFQSKKYEHSTIVYPTTELDNKTYPYFSIQIPELNNAVLERQMDYKLYLDGELLVGGFENFANLCLYDVTEDKTPEFCFTMATGSGIVDYNIVIIDPLTKARIFTLSDRGYHDYMLFSRDGQLCVLERKYRSGNLTRTGVLTYDGSKISVYWDSEINYPYGVPTGLQFNLYWDKVEAPDTESPVNNDKNPTDFHPQEFERYYPDDLYNLYDLSKIVAWDVIYATEEKLLQYNEYFYNEQLPPLYLMIKELGISKEDFIIVSDYISEEQIEWIFADADNETIMKKLKADWAFYYEGRLYNIFELAELDKELIIELRECGELNGIISYFESLNVELDALYFIKNVGK